MNSKKRKSNRFLPNSRIIFAIGIVSLLWIVLYKLWLVQVPAKNCFFYSLGEISCSLGLSIVASVFFYFFTVFFPALYKKRTVEKIIVPWFDELVSIGFCIITDVVEEKDTDVSFEEWEAICESKRYDDFKTSMYYSFHPAIANCSSWFDYFYKIIESEDTLISKLFVYRDCIPNETQSILLNLGANSDLKIYVDYAAIAFKDKLPSQLGDKYHLISLSKYIWEHVSILVSLKTNYDEFSVI